MSKLNEKSTGRILQAPSMQYGDGRAAYNARAPVDKRALRMADDRASWNLRDVKFLMPGTLGPQWAVLVIKDENRGEYHGKDDPELRAVCYVCRLDSRMNAHDGFCSMWVTSWLVARGAV